MEFDKCPLINERFVQSCLYFQSSTDCRFAGFPPLGRKQEQPDDVVTFWCVVNDTLLKLVTQAKAYVALSVASELVGCSFSKWSAKSKVKKSRALCETPSQNYGMSLAIWDHTVLPATRHK